MKKESEATGEASSSFEILAAALKQAGEEHLMSDDRNQPGWFLPHEATLRRAMELRNSACKLYISAKRDLDQRVTKRRSDVHEMTKTAFRRRHASLQRLVRFAKNDWLERRIALINDRGVKLKPTECWDAIRDIKAGMGNSKPKVTLKLRKDDGSGEFCATDEENAGVFARHFNKVYNINSSFDFSALDLVEQRPINYDLNKPPSEEEVLVALTRMSNRKAAGDDNIPPEYYKSLARCEKGLELLMECLLDFWSSGISPSEWRIGRLKILPKKGDLSDPNKWRGIMLLNVACKLISSVISRRLQAVLDEHGLEAQCGFTSRRGTNDGSFSLRRATQLRKEFGKDTWLVFVDLVKAFDSVPRDGLFEILKKLEYHLIS